MFTFVRINYSDVLKIENWNRLEPGNTSMGPYFENYDRNGTVRGPDNCDAFVCFHSNEVLGLIEYYQRSRFLEIASAINPAYRGQGFEEVFLSDGVRHGISRWPGHSRVVANVLKADPITFELYSNYGFAVRNEDDQSIDMEIVFETAAERSRNPA